MTVNVFVKLDRPQVSYVSKEEKHLLRVYGLKRTEESKITSFCFIVLFLLVSGTECQGPNIFHMRYHCYASSHQTAWVTTWD